MKDTIYREDAIATIGVMYERCDTHDIIDYRDLMLEAVKVLPSADTDISEYSDKLWRNAYERGKADRPQGEWIKDNLGTVICSECKRPRRDSRVNHINFCNSCGARMKGADDE